MQQALKDIALSGLENLLMQGQTVLRSHQLEAEAGILEALRYENAVHVDMATGSGKTPTMLTAAMSMGLSFIYVTPRKGLNKDSENTLTWLGMPSDQFGVYDSTRGQTEKQRALQAHGLITSYDSFVSLAQSGQIDPQTRPLLILDEMQRATGIERERQLNPFFEQAIVIGCSATPEPAAYLFGNRPPAYQLKLREAILRGGIVCQGLKTAAMEIEMDMRELAVYSWDSDVSEKALSEIAHDDGMINSSVHFYATHQDDDIGQIYGKPTILFTYGVSAAKKAADRFNTHFGRELAVVVSGKTSMSERERIKAAFDGGDIKVLCNADLYIEGFDSSPAQICLSLRPTYRAWIVGQQLGRITRMFGDKISLAVNFYPRRMQPVLFGEVLQEAATYSPTVVRDRGNAEKYGSVPENMDLALPDFTFYGHYEEVAKVLADMQELHVQHEQQVSLRPVWPKEPRAVPEGWESAWYLQDFYIGGASELTKKILSFRDKKIAEARTTGLAEKEAEKIISETWVDFCNRGYSQAAWCISSACRQELEKTGDFRLIETKPPPPPENWESARSLRDVYSGSDETLNQKMLSFREEKIAATRAASLSDVEAETIVSKTWVGFYSKPGKKPAWYISPIGRQELEERGEFKLGLRRTRNNRIRVPTARGDKESNDALTEQRVKRTHHVNVRVTSQEYDLLELRALRINTELSTYVRSLLLGTPIPMAPEVSLPIEEKKLKLPQTKERPNRTHHVAVRVTSQEYATLESDALKFGNKLSTYVRSLLLGTPILYGIRQKSLELG